MTTTAVPRAAGSATVGPAPFVPRRRPSPRWWADTGGVAAGLSLLIVTALWVSNQGVQQLLAGGPDAVSAAGRLTGLWASDLLLLQVLLMARVPLVERAFGQDRLARWHRWTGFTSFHLMVAHIVLITIGYAGSGHTAVVAELWDLVVTYPGMLLATAGTALLVMVVVTSMRAARRESCSSIKASRPRLSASSGTSSESVRPSRIASAQSSLLTSDSPAVAE